MTGQNSMYIWCRDHRLHHRYSDTDADPHNAKRGFFFSHVGWLMVKKHPLVKQLGKNTNISDLKADWMVMFQYKYYFPLYFLVGVLLPIAVPVYFFGESWKNAIYICYFARNAIQLNATWLINSAGHLHGTRPYDAFFERIGLAWDLKTASPDLVKQRILRTGDGSHYQLGAEPRKEVQLLSPTLAALLDDLDPEGRPLYYENDVSQYLKE